jgi:hypothetical protein
MASVVHFLKRHPFLLVGMVLALSLYVLAIGFQLDLFNAWVAWIRKGDAFQLDEMILPLIIVLISLLADAIDQHRHARKQDEALAVYNQMNAQIMEEISGHLTKLLEFRAVLMKEAPQVQSIRQQLDRIIVKSFNHYERAQRRADIDSSLMPLVMAESQLETAPAPLPRDFFPEPRRSTHPAPS